MLSKEEAAAVERQRLEIHHQTPKNDPAKMPARHIMQVRVGHQVGDYGYIQRSTVVVHSNGDTYLIVGKRINPNRSKTFQLFMEPAQQGGYALYIPATYRVKWEMVDIAVLENTGEVLVPVTKIIIGDPPE